ETEIVLAADLGDGTDDPRATAPDLLRRALACLPAAARAGRVAMRADAGYFAGQLARDAPDAQISFAIGAKRIAPLWRPLDRPAAPRAGSGGRDLRLLVHPDEPGRVQPGPGRRRRALVPAPHHGGEHLPRQQAGCRPPAPPVC